MIRKRLHKKEKIMKSVIVWRLACYFQSDVSLRLFPIIYRTNPIEQVLAGIYRVFVCIYAPIGQDMNNKVYNDKV